MLFAGKAYFQASLHLSREATLVNWNWRHGLSGVGPGKELEEKAWLVGNHTEALLERYNELRRKFQDGREALSADFSGPDRQKKQFALWRQVVETVVKRVNMRADKLIQAVMEFDVLPTQNQNSLSQ